MRCLLLILAASLPASAPANVDATWNEGVECFERGKAALDRPEEAKAWFAKAAAKFSDLEQSGLRDPALWRNLGNSCYLADRLPEAILAYRQGLLFDPGNAELRDALAIARSQVARVDDAHGLAETETWPAWLPWPGFGGLLAIGGMAWSAACLTAWIAWRKKSVKFGLLAGILTATAILTGATWKARTDLAAADNAVVVRDDAVALRRGNGPHYPAHPDLPVLRRGMEARRLHERGGWSQIRFASGELGWVPSDALVGTK
jgi:tetratricopeptide (TPR) repeat protein